MTKVVKVLGIVVSVAAVVAISVFAYRRAGMLAGSLVVLAALIAVALLARREAAREERVGMDEWKEASADSDAASEELFGDWSLTSPAARGRGGPVDPDEAELLAALNELGAPPRVDPSPRQATPVQDGAPAEAPAAVEPVTAEPVAGQAVTEQDTTEPSAVEADATEELPVESRAAEDAPTEPTPDRVDGGTLTGFDDPAGWDPIVTMVSDTAPVGGGRADVAPEAPWVGDDPDTPVTAPVEDPERELVTAAHRRPVIDWTGAGRSVEEQVRSSDDILAASDATALPEPVVAATGGSELARLLAKVEARLRDYD